MRGRYDVSWGWVSSLLAVSMQKKRPNLKTTLPETNIAPGGRPFQKEIHLPTPVIQLLCSFQGR